MVFEVGGCCGLIIHVDDFGYDDDGSCGGEIVGRGSGGGDGNSNYGSGNGSGSKVGENDSDRGCGGEDTLALIMMHISDENFLIIIAIEYKQGWQ